MSEVPVGGLSGVYVHLPDHRRSRPNDEDLAFNERQPSSQSLKSELHMLTFAPGVHQAPFASQPIARHFD